MLPKLSVKKPMTIFVAVIVVIVLGIVSVFKMTPDLLPNMDFPYAIILTTYPGQTPETVESVVTKPLEQSLSTIDGVKTITSTSSDNYSMLTLEFEDGTNMDTATVDMRGNLDTIKDAWPDGVGSPYLMKINPNMMPVAMVAVDYDGYDTVQISDYVNNELKNQLEGIDGVASVSTKGIVTQKENVIISQTKIDALNAKINDALNDKFGDAEKKISDAKKELQDNISKVEQGSDTIEQSINDLNSQQEEVAKQLADAQGKAQSGYTEILNAKMQLLDQQQSLTATKQTLTIAYQTLTQIKEKLDSLQDEKAQLTQQIETFEKASMLLQEAFPYKILRHICNSAGIERFPGAQFDMVRLGIGLYGISPIDNSIMHNVSTLKTTILQIRDVPEEDTVGYSRKGHLTRPSRIAAIPIGYADGLNRHLGNGHAYCLVNGQRAPYVGNICMDVCMIDVTDIDCKEGDSVEIFGDHLPITVLSDVLGTIPYEVLTSVSTRVKRVYYQD